MMNLAAFLVGMVGPLVARIIASLGFTLLTVTGLTAAVTQLRTMVVSSIGQLPADVVQLGGLMGIWECFGLVLGAASFVVAWRSTQGFWMLAKK
jgi:hypothetical protein